MSRILVLTPRFPCPPIGGDRLRIYHLCRGLARYHRLTLLSLCDSQKDLHAPADERVFPEVHRVLLPRWRSVLQSAVAVVTGEPLQVAYYRSSEFRDAVEVLLPAHDLALAHLIRTAPYLERRREVPRVLEMTDALSRMYRRASVRRMRGLMGRVYPLEAERVARYERKVLESFDRVSVVSAKDRDFLLDGGHAAGASRSLRVFGNGVDLSSLPWVGSADSSVVAFVGNMNSAANQDACRFFADEVGPVLRRRIPEMTFRIVGRASPATLRQFRDWPGVEVTGEVPSITDAVRGAFCAVCPTRIAVGVQNKLLEYMALGLPAVATPSALEGLGAKDGQEVLVGHTAEDIARQILALHRNQDLRASLARAARAYVERHHAWDDVLRDYTAWVEAYLGNGSSVHAPQSSVPAAG